MTINSAHIEQLLNILKIINYTEKNFNENIYCKNYDIEFFLSHLKKNIESTVTLLENGKFNGSIEICRGTYEIILNLLFFLKEENKEKVMNKIHCFYYEKYNIYLKELKNLNSQFLEQKQSLDNFEEFKENINIAIKDLENKIIQRKRINKEVTEEINRVNKNLKYPQHYDYFSNIFLTHKNKRKKSSYKDLTKFLEIENFHNIYPTLSMITHGQILEFYNEENIDSLFSNCINTLGILICIILKKINIIFAKEDTGNLLEILFEKTLGINDYLLYIKKTPQKL
ncbi:MAG: hypothetical protein ACRC0W_02670 [Cetobacterium sp.]